MAYTCREKIGVYVSETKKIGKEYRKADREMITEADDTVTRSSFFATLTKPDRGNGVVNLSWNRAVSGIGRSRRVFRFAIRSSSFED